MPELSEPVPFLDYIESLVIPSKNGSDDRKLYDKCVKHWENEGEPYNTTYGFVDYAIEKYLKDHNIERK